MIRVDDVAARLEAQVPSLAGLIGGASDFTRMITSGALPQQPKRAFVLPGDLMGGAADAATGKFRQGFVQTVSVALFVRVAADPTGKRGLDEVTPLIRDVVRAIAGWVPDACLGTFVLGRGALVSMEAGSTVYQIDFNLNDQLRIDT